MALDNTVIQASITGADLSANQDLSVAHAVLNLQRGFGLANGTGIGQADKIWSDTRTIAPSGTDDIDLAGALTDALGALVTFARVKVMMFYAYSSNVNNLIIGNAAATQFLSWVGAATHVVNVRPGGLLLLGAPDATAYVAGAGTADLLRVTNSAAGTSVTYDVVLIGASA